MNNKIAEMKNTLEGINGRIKEAEYREYGRENGRNHCYRTE